MRAMNHNGQIVLDLLGNTQDVGRAAAIAAMTHFDADLRPGPREGTGFFEARLDDRVDGQLLSQYIARLMLVQALADDISPKDAANQALEILREGNHDTNARFDPISMAHDVSPQDAK